MSLNLLKRSFLVVDDLDPMRMVTVNQLRSMGCDKITAVRSGAEALRRLRAQRVDAIIASWNMEGMSGLELLRTVRADPKLADVPFLMITAEAQRHHVQEIILAGVNSLLIKPYTVGGLSSRLSKMLLDADRASALAESRRAQASSAAGLQAALREEVQAIARQRMHAALADVLAQLKTLTQDAGLAPAHAAQLHNMALGAQQALDWVALTEELVELAGNRAEASLDPVDLGSLLHRHAESLREVYANKNLQLVVDADTRVGTETPMAEVNESLCDALVQLVTRMACDAAPPRSRITITLFDEDPLRVQVGYPAALNDEQAAGFFAKTEPKPDDAAAPAEATAGGQLLLRLVLALGGDAVAKPAQMPDPRGGAGVLMGTQITFTLPRHAFSPLP